MPKEKYNPADKYAWGEGSIEIIKRGNGGPLISEEELDCILREPGTRLAGSATCRIASRSITSTRSISSADGTTVNWAEHVKQAPPAKANDRQRRRTIHIRIHRR